MQRLIAIGVTTFFAMVHTPAVAGAIGGVPVAGVQGTVAPAKDDKKVAETKKDAAKEKPAEKHKEASKHKADDKTKPKAPEKSADPKGAAPYK